LAIGMGAGHIILLVAVFAILITAPLGALGIDFMRLHVFCCGIQSKTICSEESHLE